jgi:hypothetical protein
MKPKKKKPQPKPKRPAPDLTRPVLKDSVMAPLASGVGPLGLALEWLPISELVLNPRNPRTISEDGLGRIGVSIAAFGFLNPVIAWWNEDKRREVVVGHQRIKAAVEKHEDHVLVIMVPFKTRQEAEGFGIADNRTAEFSTWDFPKLKDTFEFLDDGAFNLESTGFKEGEIGELMKWTHPAETGGGAGTGKAAEIVCPECGFRWDGKAKKGEA